MPRSIELLTYPDHIIFLRREWGKAIEMKISIEQINLGNSQAFNFPESEKALSINGLDKRTGYKIKIKGGSLYSKVTNRSRSISIANLDATPRILFIGSGRCGTTSIANFLNGLKFNDGSTIKSRHETLFEYVLPAIIDDDVQGVVKYFKGFWHDIESAPHLTPFAAKLPVKKIIHIIRDGRRVVQSGTNRGWYQKDDMWESIKPSFSGSVFEKACYFWAHMVKQAEKQADRTIRLEDITSSEKALNDLLNYLDIEPTTKKFPVANTGSISSTFEHWTDKFRTQFADICGPLMDKYYPNWKDE